MHIIGSPKHLARFEALGFKAGLHMGPEKIRHEALWSILMEALGQGPYAANVMVRKKGLPLSNLLGIKVTARAPLATRKDQL